MVSTIRGLLWLSVLFVITGQHAFSAQVSARLDKALITLDETVTLTISLDSTRQITPDFSALKKDFRILKISNTSSLHNERSLNNKLSVTSIKKNWVLLLSPLRKGKIKLPILRIGNERTPPVSLQVNDKGSDKKPKSSKPLKKADDVFVEIDTDLQEVYVQGQLVLTQKIFHAIPLDEASLSPPSIKNGAAEIIELSKTDPYYWRFNGKRYHVIERSYALFPKHSGVLEIETAKFNGKSTVKKDDPFSLLTGASVTRKVSATASGVTLKVKARDQAYVFENWLPAKNVSLYANWSRSSDTSVPTLVGEPVSLVMGIIADGLRAEQLPEIKLEIPAGIKTYYDRVELKNNITLTGITGVWSQKVTFYPSQAKALQIPDFTLAWWNVGNDEQEVSRLKIPVLSVEAGSLKSQEAVKNAGKSLGKDITETQVMKENVPIVSQANVDIPSGENSGDREHNKGNVFSLLRWLWLPMLMLIVYLIYRQFFKPPFKEGSRFATEVVNTVGKEGTQGAIALKNKQKQIMQSLRSACLENNPKKVEKLLPEWALYIAQIQPPTLETIANVNKGYLESEINLLSQSQYARLPNSWKGVSLWGRIKNYPYQEDSYRDSSVSQADCLEKMYPSGL